jgi:hypothetical protein
MTRLRITTLLLCCVTFTQAQSTFRKNVDSLFNGAWPGLPDRYVTVYLEPLALLDPAGGSLRGGVEWAWNPCWSVYGGAGLYLDQGYMVRVGVKRYLPADPGEKDRFALGLDAMHAWHICEAKDVYAVYDSSVKDEEPSSRPLDYWVEKDVTTLDLILSYEKSFWNYCTLSMYVGIGGRYRRGVVGITPALQDSAYHYNYGGGYFAPFEDNPGTFLQREFMAGMTVGILLTKRRQ